MMGTEYNRLAAMRLPVPDVTDQSPAIQERVNLASMTPQHMAALMASTGQSNGTGTQVLPTAEQIAAGDLPNVWCLTRATAINGTAWTDEADWVWSPFESNAAVYNLCQTGVGHQKNFVVEAAREWQARIDGGEALPDLYIIHMSQGGNGFRHGGNDRFNPASNTYRNHRENIWHGMLKLHEWALRDLTASHSAVMHLGVVNNQWESDAQAVNAATNYMAMVQAWLAEFDKQAGVQVPYTYWVPRSPNFAQAAIIRDALPAINRRNVIALDTDETGVAPAFYDNVHYTQAMHDALEAQWWDKDGNSGVLVTSPSQVFEPYEFVDTIVPAPLETPTGPLWGRFGEPDDGTVMPRVTIPRYKQLDDGRIAELVRFEITGSNTAAYGANGETWVFDDFGALAALPAESEIAGSSTQWGWIKATFAVNSQAISYSLREMKHVPTGASFTSRVFWYNDTQIGPVYATYRAG